MEYQDSQLDTPKSELIVKLKGYINEAEKAPLSELCIGGDYTRPESRYPQTKGERLTDAISTLLASQSWIDSNAEPILDEILDITGQLDIDVNRPDAWQELFKLARKL